MNTLKSARQEIQVLLNAAGVGVHGFIPPRVTPPIVIVEPGNPYMEQGQTFTDFTVRFSLILLTGNAANEVATDELDALICSVIDALDTFDIEQVETPSGFELNGAQYLGTRLQVVTSKELMT